MCNASDKDKLRVKQRLLEFAATLPKDASFTVREEANAFLKSSPFAFLIAACLDRGARAESVWELPWNLALRLRGLRPAALADMDATALEQELRQLPKKPRYPAQAARTIINVAKLVLAQPGQSTSLIWNDKPVNMVRNTLQSIFGVGPGIANMTIRILIDEGMYRPSVDQLREVDVKPDVHVTRVFYRSGLSASRDAEACVEAARKLHPQFPASLDWAAWEVGRSHCHETGPHCPGCPLDAACLRRPQ